MFVVHGKLASLLLWVQFLGSVQQESKTTLDVCL